MSGTFKGWIPSDYLDEAVPGCRAKPDDWLVRQGDVLTIDQRDDGGEMIRGGEPMLVKEGDPIGFEGLTEYGTFELRWLGNRRYELRSPVPEGATQFWLRGDMDTMAYSLKEFLEINSFEVGEVVEVDCYDWSERFFELRGGVFVEVEAPVDVLPQ